MSIIISEVAQSGAMGASAWLVGHHFLTGTQVDGFVGSIVFLATAAYSAYARRAEIMATFKK